MSFGTSLRYNDFMRNIDQIFVALGTDNGLLPASIQQEISLKWGFYN